MVWVFSYIFCQRAHSADYLKIAFGVPAICNSSQKSLIYPLLIFPQIWLGTNVTNYYTYRKAKRHCKKCLHCEKYKTIQNYSLKKVFVYFSFLKPASKLFLSTSSRTIWPVECWIHVKNRYNCYLSILRIIWRSQRIYGLLKCKFFWKVKIFLSLPTLLRCCPC